MPSEYTDSNEKSTFGRLIKKTPKMADDDYKPESSRSSASQYKIKDGKRKKVHKLSPAMKAICGRSEMGWHDVNKKLWVYIKSKELQSADDKNTINCDAKMKALTNKSIVKVTEIAQIINENLTEIKNEEPEENNGYSFVYNKDLSDIQNFVNFMDQNKKDTSIQYKERAFMEALEWSMDGDD